jgi:RNA-directed DNA polymerase
LLANLLLDDLDRELERRGHRFCRYADDCNIYVRSLAAGQRVMESVVRFLEGSSGCASTAERAPSLRLGNANSSAAPKSITRAKEKIRQITRRNRGVSLVQVIIELNLFLVGWLTFCRYAAFRFELQCLDEWIRRKLRCYRLKQCKRGSTIAKLLQRLGASPSLAHRAASSGKGWWRLSLTRPVHQAMSQEWFATQGLVSLIDKYDALRH